MLFYVLCKFFNKLGTERNRENLDSVRSDSGRKIYLKTMLSKIFIILGIISGHILPEARIIFSLYLIFSKRTIYKYLLKEVLNHRGSDKSGNLFGRCSLLNIKIRELGS